MQSRGQGERVRGGAKGETSEDQKSRNRPGPVGLAKPRVVQGAEIPHPGICPESDPILCLHLE